MNTNLHTVMEEQVAHAQNMAAPCCELDTDGDGDCPRHHRYQDRPRAAAPSVGIRLDRYCQHCGYATNAETCMSCGRATKALHAAAQGRDDLYVCPHGSMAPFPCTAGDSVKLQPAPSPTSAGAAPEREAPTPRQIERIERGTGLRWHAAERLWIWQDVGYASLVDALADRYSTIIEGATE